MTIANHKSLDRYLRKHALKVILPLSLGIYLWQGCGRAENKKSGASGVENGQNDSGNPGSAKGTGGGSGAGEPGEEPVNHGPLEVLEVSPKNADNKASISAPIIITFNNVIKAPEGDPFKVFKLQDAPVIGIPGALQAKGNTLVFNPGSQLQRNKSHTANLYAAVEDVFGQKLKSSKAWNFFTLNSDDKIPPTIAATNASSVHTAGGIVVSFNEEMDMTSISSASVAVKDGGGVIVPTTLTKLKSSVLLKPQNALTAGGNYQIFVSKEAKDLVGNLLGADSSTPLSVSSSAGPFGLSSGSPANASQNNSVETKIKAVFSAAIDLTSVLTTNVTLTGPGGAAVAGSLDVENVNTVVFIPNASLSFNTTYTLNIGTGLKSASGVALGSAAGMSFTTGAPLGIASTAPTKDSSGNASSIVPSITFDQDLNATTLGNGKVLIIDENGNFINSTAVLSGRTLTFNPEKTLYLGKTMSVSVPSSLRSAIGNPIQGTYTLSFKITPDPTWEATIKPIFAQRCGGCHAHYVDRVKNVIYRSNITKRMIVEKTMPGGGMPQGERDLVSNWYNTNPVP